MRYGTVGLRMRREAIHDDGHVEHADGHDVGHGAYLASRVRVSGARDSRVHKVSSLVTERQPPALLWLLGLRVYLGAIFVGNLLWEVLQLPLYTIWTTGTPREQAFAAGHCTLGDLLIAAGALMLALLLVGDQRWPWNRFWPVAVLTIAFGLAYTVFSEWLNVVVRATWAYSDRMPIVSIAGVKIGLSPLLQWIVLPAAAFAIVRRVTIRQAEGERR
jgi:hypothetical protein